MQALSWAVLVGCGMAMPAPVFASAGSQEHCRTRVVAHRADMSRETPENSLAAIRAAAELGLRWVELDVRATRDGRPVVLHDATVRRTTTGSGRVRRMSLAQVQSLKLHDGTTVPRLAQALKLIDELNLSVVLDLKSAAHLELEHFLPLVTAHVTASRVVVGVRTAAALKRVRALNPAIKTLGFVSNPNQIRRFVAMGVSAIRVWPHRALADRALLAALRADGVEVWVTSGNMGGRKMQQLLALNLAAVITDRPAALLSERCCC